MNPLFISGICDNLLTKHSTNMAYSSNHWEESFVFCKLDVKYPSAGYSILKIRHNYDWPQLNNDSPQLNNDSPQLNNHWPQLNNDSPQLNNDSPQLNNDSPQFFCYDYVLILILTIRMIKYAIFITC